MLSNIALMHRLHLLDADKGGNTGAGSSETNGGTGNNANDGASDDGSNDSDEHTPTSDETGSKKYDDNDVDEIVKRKFAEWQKKSEAEKSQAEKLAKMTAAQRAEAEKKAAEDKAADLEAKLNAYNMRDTARDMFAKNEINVSDADLALVVTPDAETTQKNVDQLTDFAKRIRKAAEHDYLNGDATHVNANKAGAKGSFGASLAKSALASSSRPNPYFNNDTKTK